MAALRSEIDGDPLWTLEQAAGYLGVSVHQVRYYYQQHDLTVTRLGPKIIRVRKSQVEDLLRRHTGPWSQAYSAAL